MTPRLRDVVVEQRTKILRLVDRAERRDTPAALRELGVALLRRIAAEEAVVVPLVAGSKLGASYRGELHALLRFLVERLVSPEATREERIARLHVLRDLVVHQAEHDELVFFELVEHSLGARGAAAAARRFARALAEEPQPPTKGVGAAERRTGR